MAAPTTLKDLAALVGGEVIGDPATRIDNAWPPQDCDARSITLIDSAESLPKLADCLAAAAVTPADVEEDKLDRPAIRVADVHAAFTAIVMHYRPRRERATTGVHPTAIIAKSARLGEAVSIGPGAVVGEDAVLGDGVVIGANSVVSDDCRIGRASHLGSRVTLNEATTLGERCRLHSGVVLGADGFGYRQVDGRHVPVPQLGTVEIGDDVEIGANTTIDRGVYGPTKIGDGTKIDNLVQIGHNCRIGRHNLLCSQVGIAGSTTTGDYVVMAGQVGVRDHISIGKGAIISAQAGVTNHVRPGEVMLGAPATPLREQKLKLAAIAKLPQLRKEFRELRKEIAELQRRLDEGGSHRLPHAA
ncbi:UDP-3-O-acylglucosamine N-acyltransferase [Planctomycetes bacterium MalM25]|nr:UDP-3-O-acylglucosamine N-acyltransferase [Planctomycetes bacterium MalM25]